ncbi:MAG: hypothetical protein K2Q28_09770 [Hyphomicrobium sp.]|nr:hypothetical protein [Hyphomicrobium sp.]
MTKWKKPSTPLADAQPQHDGCTCQNLAQRSSLRLTATEELLLDVIRFQCMAIATHDRQALVAAHQLAAARLGQAAAPRLIISVGAMMQAMRKERACPFGFLPPCCLVVSPDEADLIALLRACRTRDPLLMEASSAELAHGTSSNRLISAAKAIAAAVAASPQSQRDLMLEAFADLTLCEGATRH